VAATSFSAYKYRRNAGVFVGALWFVIALVPVSNVLIPTGILIAERTLFLPSIGFLIAIVALIEMAGKRRGFENLFAERVARFACGLVVIAGIARSAERQLVWRNEGYYAARAIKDSPMSFRAQIWFGDALFGAGRADLARDAYGRALALVPAWDAWRVHNGLANQLDHQGDETGAVDQWRASVRQRPDQEFERGSMIVHELSLGRYASAKADADSAVAAGAKAAIFSRLGAVADSAARAGAPPGSIQIGLEGGNLRRVQ
jgi:tetratricopeptide (TPR) repeat protein